MKHRTNLDPDEKSHNSSIGQRKPLMAKGSRWVWKLGLIWILITLHHSIRHHHPRKKSSSGTILGNPKHIQTENHHRQLPCSRVIPMETPSLHSPLTTSVPNVEFIQIFLEQTGPRHHLKTFNFSDCCCKSCRLHPLQMFKLFSFFFFFSSFHNSCCNIRTTSTTSNLKI